jgi:hypothetical protein
MWRIRFVVLPSSTYLFTVGVEGFYFHLITLKHTTQSVGLLWARDRPVAETSTWQHTNTVQGTNIHALGGIQTHDPIKRLAADLRLRPRGHWDRLIWRINYYNCACWKQVSRLNPHSTGWTYRLTHYEYWRSMVAKNEDTTSYYYNSDTQ